MELRNKRPRYRSAAPTVEGPGATALLARLVRRAATGAPDSVAGNLLVHGSCDDANHHHLAGGPYRFRESRPVAPGLHHTILFPVTASVETNDRFTDEAAAVQFRYHGEAVDPLWLEGEREWTPWGVRDGFTVGPLKGRQHITVAAFEYADVLLCRLELEGDLEGWTVQIEGRVYRPVELRQRGSTLQGRIAAEAADFHFVTRPDYPGPWGDQPPPSKAVGACFEVGVLSDAESVLGTPRPDGTYGFRCSASRVLTLLFGAGFEADEVATAMATALGDPPASLDRARQQWYEAFRHDVPALSCSDPTLERFYAEAMATGFLSTFDVPYDPFRHPINVPAGRFDTNWHQQFWHDSLFGSRAFLWLNDAERCKQDLLQMIDVQFIHASPHLGAPYVDPAHLLHPQLNFLAMVAWQIFCRTQDRDLIRIVLDRFLDFDRRKCRPPEAGTEVVSTWQEDPPFSYLKPHRHFDPEGNGLVTSALSGDDTCRADPFREGSRPKHWYEEPDVALEVVDSNFTHLANRRALKRMAEALGRSDLAVELDAVISGHIDAIERLLWHPSQGRYLDFDVHSGRATTVADIGSITPALANGLVSPERAERLIADLLNPETFWTPLPCPSCPVNHAGTHGKPGFRPEGYWRGRVWPLYLLEAIEGLAEYGRRDHAAYLVHLVLQTLGATSVPTPENFHPLDRSVPGIGLMSWGSQLIDPLLRFVSGLQMRQGDDLEFDPLALDPEWDTFHFGPFQYRAEEAVTVSWSRAAGYHVRVNGQEWSFPRPTRFRLRREATGYRLEDAVGLTFAGRPPVLTTLKLLPEGAGIRLSNTTAAAAHCRVQARLLTYDHSLIQSLTREVILPPHGVWDCVVTETDGAQWLLTATTVDGYAVTVAEGLSLLTSPRW